MRVCVRACMHACVCACVRVCVRTSEQSRHHCNPVGVTGDEFDVVRVVQHSVSKRHLFQRQQCVASKHTRTQLPFSGLGLIGT